MNTPSPHGPSPILLDHQRLPTAGARAAHVFMLDGNLRLAIPQLAVDKPDSPAAMNGRHSNISLLLYRWTAGKFIADGELPVSGGEDACFFTIGNAEFLAIRAGGKTYLAFANLQGESLLYRWEHGSFVRHQSISGPGAREFALIETRSGLYLIQVNFILGTPAAPKTDLVSYIYRWQDEMLVKVEEFATFGATDAATFSADGRRYVVISNSLSRDIRFREDSVVYRFNG